MTFKYKNVALGGTFDLLHKGHIALLEKAFTVSKFVTIGVTTDKFCRQLGKSPYRNQRQRREKLLEFSKSKSWAKRAKIIWLNDTFGSTLTNKSQQAIVVSKETRKGADLINRQRTKRKLRKLTVIVVPQVLAFDKKPISTGRIRKGEIDTVGKSYENLLMKIAGIRFRKTIREKLKKLLGNLSSYPAIKKAKPPIIAIGDVTTAKLFALKVAPKLAVVDFFVNRKRTYQNLAELGISSPNPDYLVKNIRGQISKQLITAVKKSYSSFQNQVILVDGEEDLAFIPALLLAPIPSTVFYGQPKIGLVKIETTVLAKDKLCALLNQTE